MSSNNTSNQPHCLHTDTTPLPASAATAAEAFCICMERHVLQSGINRIAKEEALLHRVEQAAAKLLHEEGDTADGVRAKIERAATVLRRARAACRGGRELMDMIGGDSSTAPVPIEHEQDQEKGANGAEEGVKGQQDGAHLLGNENN